MPFDSGSQLGAEALHASFDEYNLNILRVFLFSGGWGGVSHTTSLKSNSFFACLSSNKKSFSFLQSCFWCRRANQTFRLVPVVVVIPCVQGRTWVAESCCAKCHPVCAALIFFSFSSGSSCRTNSVYARQLFHRLHAWNFALPPPNTWTSPTTVYKWYSLLPTPRTLYAFG